MENQFLIQEAFTNLLMLMRKLLTGTFPSTIPVFRALYVNSVEPNIRKDWYHSYDSQHTTIYGICLSHIASNHCRGTHTNKLLPCSSPHKSANEKTSWMPIKIDCTRSLSSLCDPYLNHPCVSRISLGPEKIYRRLIFETRILEPKPFSPPASQEQLLH